MEKIDKNMGEILGEIGCRFRSNIENHIKDYKLQKEEDNVEWLLEPLDLISHPSDLVLDAFRTGDFMGWVYQLYFHHRDASAIYVPFDPPYEKFNGKISLFDLDDDELDSKLKPYDKTMIVKSMANYIVSSAVPEIWDDLNVPFTEMGIWQALLLYRTLTFMPKGWHGNYLNHWYIFSQDDMQRIVDKYSSYKSVDHEKLESYLGRDDILPSVNIDGDKAVVSYCIWTRWGGLCRLTVPVERLNQSVIFGKGERQTLVKYDCGWLY